MPEMNVTVAHNLRPEEVVRRIKAETSELMLSEFDISWEGNTASFTATIAGITYSGTLEVTADEVRVSGELPWKALIFRSQIETAIRERATTLLT